MTRADAAARVVRGMALLNEKVPGWVEKVDLRKLDIDDCYLCVLGQVFGDFSHGSHVLLNFRDAEPWGFAVPFGEPRYITEAAWRDAITARRHAV